MLHSPLSYKRGFKINLSIILLKSTVKTLIVIYYLYLSVNLCSDFISSCYLDFNVSTERKSEQGSLLMNFRYLWAGKDTIWRSIEFWYICNYALWETFSSLVVTDVLLLNAGTVDLYMDVDHVRNHLGVICKETSILLFAWALSVCRNTEEKKFGRLEMFIVTTSKKCQ